MRFSAALLAPLLLCACSQTCPRAETLVGLDGGVALCVTSTDCPRPSSILVCGSLEDHLRDCVQCVGTQCVRYVPEACP
jgi:hypothetical protein